MKTIKKNADSLKGFVVEFKKELALIIGGTAIAVAGTIVLRSVNEEANKRLEDPAIQDAWNTILN